MKKLYYIQPNTKIVELESEAELLTTSDIDNPIDIDGVGNGDGDDEY